jgi:transmembrane sensor
MSEHKEMPKDEARLAAATEWFGRLQEENLPPDAIAAWLQWCEADPENLRAYRGVQEIWALAGDAGVVDWPHAQSVVADEYDGDVPVAQWRKQVTPIISRARWRRSGWAAAALILLALATWHWAPLWYSNSTTPQYATARGVQRAVQLADGSAVELGGASAVRVAYGEKWREVELEGGEAYFKVARDPARPFVVHTSSLKITALGTAFSVRIDDSRTVIAVTDGRVEIAPLSSTAVSKQTRRVLQAGAGQQFTYDGASHEPAVYPFDTAAALGWQDGALTYVDEPLGAVVARINRYSSYDVRLAPELGELRFTGTVFEAQLEEWASGLERVFPVRAVVSSDGDITLEAIQ